MFEQADWLRAGKLCVYPTSTQPAIGSLPKKDSLDLLFRVKKRPISKPVSLGVSSLEQASKFVFIPDNLQQFLNYFPRGSLTVLLPPKNQPDVRLGQNGLAIRILENQLARELVDLVGPLSATSANESGKEPHVSCKLAAEELGGLASGVHWIDGICKGGAPSTLISYPSEIIPSGPRRPERLRTGIVPENKVIEAWKKLT